jgi:hypothetical protein
VGIKRFDNGIAVVTRFGFQQSPANEFSNLAFPYLDRQTAKARARQIAKYWDECEAQAENVADAKAAAKHRERRRRRGIA